MDEEKQNNDLMKKTSDALKKGAKDQAKKSMQKVFKKIVMAIVPILLKFLVIVLIAAIIVTAISNVLDLLKGKSSKDADAFAVDYSSHATEESSNNRIIVDVNNISENGAYNLDYEFKDEEGNVLSEDEAIKKIKEDLLEENNKLNLSKFSDAELKIIGALMYNGLKVDKYTEEELKALTIFVKADIASQSFDLREAGKIGEKITLDDVRDSNEVFGTLQVHRTKVEIDGNGELKYTPVKLEYVTYGDENTPGTFCYMVAQKDLDVINKFSTDEEGNLVVAKWSTTTMEYTYQDKNGRKLSEDDKKQIPEENIKENKSETYISVSKIEYQRYITRYIASYGLLSDLLVVTQNVEFCEELAELAFNSKIVINVKEELTTTDSSDTSNYIQTNLLYDYVKYEVYGQKKITTKNWEMVISGSGAPSDDNIVLTERYGWNSSMNPVSVTGNSSGGILIYEWTNYNVNYRLKHTATRTYSNWILYKEVENTSYEDLPKETNLEQEGDLINLNNNHIKEEYEDYTIDEDYTDTEIFEYTIISKTHSESNRYNFEISEVDTWNLKYNKQYNPPTQEQIPNNGESNSIGEYPEELIQVLNTTDSNEINSDNHVIGFIAQRKGEYKNTYPEAKNIQCDVNELTVKQRVKTDIHEEYTSTTTKYKFGEEIADTTEVKLKNVEYINNEPSFNEQDENGDPEIGFLYIYNHYRQAEIDLFLQDDAEKQLFELLESDTKTIGASDIIKYLLYVYDGIDRGVTSLSLKIIDLNAFQKVKGGSTENYIKAWENGALWTYETKQSEDFPTGYLTEDELCYIVFEDGSAGHNNIAYGWATFISNSKNAQVNHPKYGWGYYNWKNEFAAEGIAVEDLYEGAYVDKQIADSVFKNEILPHFQNKVENYLAENLSEYEFSQAQKDALISICYQYGNISGFADAYENSLNEDGTINAEKLKNNYSRFSYSGIVNDRKYANWLLFTEETYIDRAGNVISVGSGSIVEAAYEVADHFMNSGVDVHYAGSDVKEATNNGRHCVYRNIQGSWDLPIENPEKYGVVCATYVSLSIWRAGLIDEETINQYGYNGVSGVEDMLMNSQYSDEWEVINNWDELQEGDIVSMEGHVFIYMEGEKCLDQNYCVITSKGKDLRGQLLDASKYRSKFRMGFRHIG